MEFMTQGDTKQKDLQSKDWNHIHLSSYYGEAAAVGEGPQVFLVDMPEPGSKIRPHFHDVDQYQVIVKGGGRLGRGQAEPIVFHYADAYTPYGPIIGGQDGISFFTIRAAHAAGHYPMPGSRHQMPGKPGRNIAGKFDINKPLPEAGQSAREALMTTDDGVEVVGLRMGPNARAAGEAPEAGDQYYLVCAGSLMHEGKEVSPMTVIRVESGEETPSFQAGPNGAAVLLTQLPKATSRPGSDPKKLAQRKLDYKLPEGAVAGY